MNPNQDVHPGQLYIRPAVKIAAPALATSEGLAKSVGRLGALG
jgi:hypothetical protein